MTLVPIAPVVFGLQGIRPGRNLEIIPYVTSSSTAARGADATLFGAMGWPEIRYPDGTEIAPQLDLRVEKTWFFQLWRLSAYLEQLKARFPDKANATLLVAEDVDYDTIVQVMDAVREGGFYIITHDDYRNIITMRHDGIVAALDAHARRYGSTSGRAM